MSKFRKAVVAAGAAALSVLVTALGTGGGVTAEVVGAALAAAVVAGAAVYRVPNATR